MSKSFSCRCDSQSLEFEYVNWRNQCGTIAFFLVWLSFWTIGVVLLAFQAYTKNELELWLVLVPFVAAWFFATGLLLNALFGKQSGKLNRDGFNFCKRILWFTQEKKIPLSEIRGFKQRIEVTHSSKGGTRTSWFVELQTTGPTIRIAAQGRKSELHGWLVQNGNATLKTLQTQSAWGAVRKPGSLSSARYNQESETIPVQEFMPVDNEDLQNPRGGFAVRTAIGETEKIGVVGETGATAGLGNADRGQNFNSGNCDGEYKYEADSEYKETDSDSVYDDNSDNSNNSNNSDDSDNFSDFDADSDDDSLEELYTLDEPIPDFLQSKLSLWIKTDDFSEISFSRRGQFRLQSVLFYLFISLFWNGIISVFLYGIIFDSANVSFSRLTCYAWLDNFLITAFFTPFVLIGLLFLWTLATQLLAPITLYTVWFSRTEVLSRTSILGVTRTNRFPVESVQAFWIKIKSDSNTLPSRDSGELAFLDGNAKPLGILKNLSLADARWLMVEFRRLYGR